LALTRGAIPLVRDAEVRGSLEFDPQQMWEVFVGLTPDALASLPEGEIAALSATSFRNGVVFLDGEGEVVYAGTNRDARSAAHGFDMAQAHGDAIYGRTGRWPLGPTGQPTCCGCGNPDQRSTSASTAC
jgi:sugar (pentulose or hexulose) kinase